MRGDEQPTRRDVLGQAGVKIVLTEHAHLKLDDEALVLATNTVGR
jgi:hypothetical protein